MTTSQGTPSAGPMQKAEVKKDGNCSGECLFQEEGRT